MKTSEVQFILCVAEEEMTNGDVEYIAELLSKWIYEMMRKNQQENFTPVSFIPNETI